MQAASRPYALAAAVLAATSAVVVTIPVAARPFQLPIRSIETRLVDASIANIPVNLFDDIMNIPYNWVQAINGAAGSFFMTGNWWVPGSTNIWGIDPGDTTHVASILNVIPFPALIEGNGGLAYQVDGLLAAELPVSASCDAETCAPIVPSDQITGISSIDRNIGLLETLTGQNSNFGLFNHWWTVPLSTLMSGYTFNSSTPGSIDPSGPAYADPAFGYTGANGNPFEGGTTTLADGQNAMPWYGTTYQLNLLQPFENFYNSLLATPSTSGLAGTGIELPTFTEAIQALQAVMAGMVVDFNPFVPGSPACPAECSLPANETTTALVQDIGNLAPGNPMINAWLADVAANPATDNNATPTQINDAITMLQTGAYNLTPTQLATVDADLAKINPELPALYTNAGILTDPGYLAWSDGTATTLDPVYGGLNTNLVPQDILTLLTNNATDYSQLSNLGLLLTIADPISASSVDPSTAATASDPTALSADLSTLLASFGTTAGSDLLSQMVSDLTTQLTTDLSTVLPSSILSLF